MIIIESKRSGENLHSNDKKNTDGQIPIVFQKILRSFYKLATNLEKRFFPHRQK